MFNHVKSVGCIFSLLSRLSNFGLVGKLISAVAVCWTSIRGAKSSESCLIEMQCLGEASAVCSISKLKLQVFVFSHCNSK